MPRLYGLGWLAEQSVRWLRKTYRDPHELSQEMYTVMKYLRDLLPDGTTTTNTDGTFVSQEDFQDHLDLGHPHDHPPPVVDPPDPDPPGEVEFATSIISTTTWERAAMPGKITSHVSDTDYNVDVYPFGKMDVLDANGDIFQVGPVTESVSTEQLQINTGEVYPNDTWVIVVRIIQYKVSITTVTTVSDGVIISRFKTLEELQRAHYMQAPVWV